MGSITSETGDAEFGAALAFEENGNHAAAITHYRAALAISPFHVGAIAGLGRLQFDPPPQPLLKETRRRAPVDVCEAVVAVRNPCNFRCFYCVASGRNAEPVRRFDFAKIESHFAAIRADLIVTSFDCGGGEPTVHPQFAELVRLCAAYGPVSFPTNNSQKPDRWFPKGLGKRLLIRATLHPEGEERLAQFISNARYLIDAGSTVWCMFVAHPNRIEKISTYAEIFDRNAVPFHAVPFIGTFNDKPYPFSYTEPERAALRFSETGVATRIGPHTNRIRNFRGIPCRAGYRSLYITEDGTLHRCMYDGKPLHSPLPSASACRVKSCGCGLLLEQLNTQTLPEFYNYFATMGDRAPISLDWMEPFASSLGYEDRDTGLATELTAAYDALMAAYGKDEFPE